MTNRRQNPNSYTKTNDAPRQLHTGWEMTRLICFLFGHKLLKHGLRHYCVRCKRMWDYR